MSTTTTTFIGDIKFKDGDTERLASDLATVDEVNSALVGYYTKKECDKLFGNITTVDLSDYYTKSECDKLIESIGSSSSSSSSSYEPIPYKLLEKKSSDNMFKFDADVRPTDTVRFTGFLGIETNTFTYEAILAVNSDNIHISETITTALGNEMQLTVAFISGQPIRFTINSSVYFTSIEKKVSTSSIRFKTIPFETKTLSDVQAIWNITTYRVFDGSFGDIIKMDFTYTPSQFKCSSYAKIEKLNEDFHAIIVGYLTEGKLVSYDVLAGGIQTSSNHPGKLILTCTPDFTLDAVSIPSADDNVYLSDLGINRMTFEPVPLRNIRDVSNQVLYDVDVEFGDTVMIEGFYGNQSNPISWEGELIDDKEWNNSKAAIIEFTQPSTYAIIFLSKPDFERMTMNLTDSYIVITSIKRKTASHEVVLTSSTTEEYTNIPFYYSSTYYGYAALFDGSFGDTIRIALMFYSSKVQMTIEHELVKGSDGKYEINDRVPISDDVRYMKIGDVYEHQEVPGKLMIQLAFDAMKILSISKKMKNTIITTKSLNQPAYSSCIVRRENYAVIVDAKRSDVVRITGKSPEGVDSFSFDSVVQLPSSNSISLPGTNGMISLKCDDMDGKLVIYDNSGVIYIDSVEHVYANDIERLEARIAALEAKLT